MRGDEACSQVFVNQLSALPCQTPHCSYSTSASIIILNFLGEFVVSGPKAVKVTNKSWQRTLFSPSLLISLETTLHGVHSKLPSIGLKLTVFATIYLLNTRTSDPRVESVPPSGYTMCWQHVEHWLKINTSPDLLTSWLGHAHQSGPLRSTWVGRGRI